MTILPTHTQSRIRNLAMSAVYKIAADEACEPSDVISLLSTTLLQPGPPPAPAAIAPATQAAGAATDGEASVPRPSPSVAPSLATNSSEVGCSDAPKARTDKSVRAKALAAPIKHATLADAIRKCHAENPEWPARLIARHLGISYQRVVGTAATAGIDLPTQQEYDAMQVKARTAQLAREKAHSEALPMAATLTQRIRQVHRAHPDWTAAQVANHLNAAPASVSTLLSSVRKESRQAAAPEFSGRRQMVEHYGEIAKRLGK